MPKGFENTERKAVTPSAISFAAMLASLVVYLGTTMIAPLARPTHIDVAHGYTESIKTFPGFPGPVFVTRPEKLACDVAWWTFFATLLAFIISPQFGRRANAQDDRPT